MVNKKKQSRVEKEHIRRDALIALLRHGGLFLNAVLNDDRSFAFRMEGDDRDWEGYYRSSVERQLKGLYRRGWVEIIQKNGKTVVQLSNKGKEETLSFDLENMEIAKPEKWDGRWWMIVFDISNQKKHQRDIFRRLLERLGFYSFQESVYVYPYRCVDEIRYAREVLGIPHGVKIIEVNRIENDQDLRTIFMLD